MGSPWTCDCRGGVIVPLRPDVKIEADQRLMDPADSAAEVMEALSDVPEQLSLVEESPEP